jgi:hypothetical protein
VAGVAPLQSNRTRSKQLQTEVKSSSLLPSL